MAKRTSKPATQKKGAGSRTKSKKGGCGPCGEYHVCCTEPALRCLVVHLLCDDELYQRFLKEPREVLAENGIELPASMLVDPTAFDRRKLRAMVLTAGPLLNITLGGRPILKPKARPLRRKRTNSAIANMNL